MAQQQVIISRGDSGTILEFNLQDSAKNPVAILQDTINIYVVLADNSEIKLDTQ